MSASGLTTSVAIPLGGRAERGAGMTIIVLILVLIHLAGCICMAASIVRSGLDYSLSGLALWCQIWPLYFLANYIWDGGWNDQAK